MKVLTVRQPWAAALVSGAKTIENRTWRTAPGRRIAIHAGAKPDAHAVLPPGPDGLAQVGATEAERRDLGHVLGTVALVGVHGAGSMICDSLGCSESPWALWPNDVVPLVFHWIVGDPVAFVTPIPAKGALHLWEAGPSLDYLIELGEREGRTRG